MSAPPHRRPNGPHLDEDQARKLWGHVRALEVLDEQAQEVRDDRKTRKELAKKDGFDTNIVEAIVKRRKVGAGETRQADGLVWLYEQALEEQGALPLEETAQPRPERSSQEEIAERLHGEPLPPTADGETVQ